MEHREDRERFAHSWIAAWNRGDVESVLNMYAEELSFTSPTALIVTGRATIRGKTELRAYWQSALSRIRHLSFTLERIVWDSEERELGIFYAREVDGSSSRAVETFRFDEAGLVVATDVFHGPLPD